MEKEVVTTLAVAEAAIEAIVVTAVAQVADTRKAMVARAINLRTKAAIADQIQAVQLHVLTEKDQAVNLMPAESHGTKNRPENPERKRRDSSPPGIIQNYKSVFPGKL